MTEIQTALAESNRERAIDGQIIAPKSDIQAALADSNAEGALGRPAFLGDQTGILAPELGREVTREELTAAQRWMAETGPGSFVYGLARIGEGFERAASSASNLVWRLGRGAVETVAGKDASPGWLNRVIETTGQPERYGLITPTTAKVREYKRAWTTEAGTFPRIANELTEAGIDVGSFIMQIMLLNAAGGAGVAAPGKGLMVPAAGRTTAVRHLAKMGIYGFATGEGDFTQRARRAVTLMAYNMTPYIANATGAVGLTAVGVDTMLNTFLTSPTYVEAWRQAMESNNANKLGEFMALALPQFVVDVGMAWNTRGLPENVCVRRWERHLAGRAKELGLPKEEGVALLKSLSVELEKAEAEAQFGPERPTEPPPPTEPPRPPPRQMELAREDGTSEQIRAAEEQVRALEERLAKEPAERPPSVEALEAELGRLREAGRDLAATAADLAEANRLSSRELVDEVRGLGRRAVREELEAAREVQAATKTVAEMETDALRGLRRVQRPEQPIIRALGGEKIVYDPVHEAEVKEALEGADISVRRFFKGVKDYRERVRLRERVYGTAIDEVLADLATRHILPEGTDIEGLVEAIKGEREAVRTWKSRARDANARLEELARQEDDYYYENPEKDTGRRPHGDKLAQWEDAWATVRDGAERLRADHVERRASGRLPALERRGAEIQQSIRDLETLGRQAEEAERADAQRLLKDRRAELDTLRAALAEGDKVQKMRRYIAQQRAVKGLSKKAFGEIVARYAPPGPRGGKARTTKNVEDLDALLQIAAAIERHRPRVDPRGRKIITRKTERKVQHLRGNLTADSRSTPDDFVRQLRQLGIVEPRYVGPGDFCTEAQAKDLINKMIDEGPLIEHRLATEAALAETPGVKRVVDAIRKAATTKRQAKEKAGKKGTTNPLVDTRYYAGNLDAVTGAESFFTLTMAMFKGKRDAELATRADFDDITDAIGSDTYKAIVADDAAKERVRLQIASKLRRKGAPKPPPDITPEEVRVADAFESVFEAQRNNVRFERFLSWRAEAKEIPDAPKVELNRANDIYERRGAEAAREYLDGKEWGVIGSGFEPERVYFPGVRRGPGAVFKTGVAMIETREADFQVEQKDFFKRAQRYLTQRYNAVYLQPHIRAFESLWKAHADKFADPAKVESELRYLFEELSGWGRGRHPMSNFISRAYRHSLAAVVLVSPAKFVRNMAQPLAFYTDRSELFDHANRQLTPAEQAYYRMYASQLPGMRRDFMFMDAPAFLGLGPYMDRINRWAPYGLSDEWGRQWTFWAKLNAVEKALGRHREDIPALLKAIHAEDFEPGQIRHGLEMLAREGEGAFKLYIAHETANNVHFAYARYQRAVAEMGDQGRIVGNLLAFPRGYAQRLYLQARKAFMGRGGVRNRAIKNLASLVFAAYLVGELGRRVWGKRHNPYFITGIVSWSPGGLAIGALGSPSELIRLTGEAARGDRRALDKLMYVIPTLPRMFLPGYQELVNGIDAAFGIEDVDVSGMRRLRKALSKEYDPRSPKVRRTVLEGLQKALFGGADPRHLEEKYKASRQAINFARQRGVDLSKVRGTGKGGRVTKRDVQAYLEAVAYAR